MSLVRIGLGVGRARGLGRDNDQFAFGAEVRNQVVDLVGAERVGERGHALSAIVNLMGDLLFVESLADELEVRTLMTANACGSMAMGAAVGCE
jgi:hypothetical protein